MKTVKLNNSPYSHNITLFAVLGMSPAVLSETIWALAHEPKPVIPDRVVVLTTTYGRNRLEQELFNGGSNSGWEQLKAALVAQGLPVAGRLAFGLAADHVRLFPASDGQSDLHDIVTTIDNVTAADYIMRELRSFTEDPCTTILASIAGGRKTMGALLTSCLSLLGRKQDRLLHVLVNPPYDGLLAPTFLFPAQNIDHIDNQGRKFHSSKARIELIDVPFVRMRGWYEGSFRQAPPSYAALVRGVQKQAPEPVKLPLITLDCSTGVVLVEQGDPLHLSPTEFGILLLLCNKVHKHQEIADAMANLAAGVTTTKTPDWICRMQDGGRFGTQGDGYADVEGVRKSLSSARKKISIHPLLAAAKERLLPLRGRMPDYPSKLIRVTGPKAAFSRNQS